MQLLNSVFIACASLNCVIVLDQFAEPIAVVASRYALKHTEVSYWTLRMTLLAMSGLLVIISFSSMRAAAYGASIATLWLALLATASLMVAPTDPLWSSTLGQGQPLIWGPMSVAAAHLALCIVARAVSARVTKPFNSWIPIGVGLVLTWVAWGVCARMVAGGWLLLTIGESTAQSASKLGVYAGVVLAVFLLNCLWPLDEVK
ncbi:hypothetical protein PLCT2_01617 [Planctomycetaceae bacterium]|nr:hypothetical protein PLCT2_01617 [Planctomycetaceae bacterium]